MTDPLTQTSPAGTPPSGEHVHHHAPQHAHDPVHAHSGHAEHLHAGTAVHVHRAHASPATVPAAHMAWSVLSLSVFQRLLLVAPMLVCLWLAVVWAVAG